MNIPRTSKSFAVAPALAGFGCLLLLVGCSQQISVEPGPTGSSAYCTALTQSLPVEIAGVLVRSTSAPKQGVTAWGDPAIVLRCGVVEPTSLQPTSQLISVNGVDWLPEKLTQGQRFTSLNSTEFVEVNIPSVYESTSGVLVDLAAAFPTN